MYETDDIRYHCHRCGRDLTEDEVTFFYATGYQDGTPVCSYCLDELVAGLDEYSQDDPWGDAGVSIHDFI